MRPLLTIAALLLASAPAAAQSPFGHVQGDPQQVSVSGISSGAAMAVQYALAHSGSVTAVGSVAGPGYRCAHGDIYRAIGVCMTATMGLPSADDMWQQLLASPAVDDPRASTRRLRAAYVFQSEWDATVRWVSGRSTYDLLRNHMGVPAVFDQGDPLNGSNHAAHGFVSPDGSAPCGDGGNTYVRACRDYTPSDAKDVAGDMFHYFYGNGEKPPRPPKPSTEVKAFDQNPFIAKVKVPAPPPNPRGYARRAAFDFAPTGWIYVPENCAKAGAKCPVHVAFHGCKMSATDILKPPALVNEGGYQNWAELYGVIVLYPQLHNNGYASRLVLDQHDNDNSCWDWWGYLNTDYANANGPQMRVIAEMVAELTRPK